MRSLSAWIPVAVAVMGVFPGAALAQGSKYDTYTGFELPGPVVLPEEEIHPGLWFGSDGIPSLVAKKTADAYARSVWREVESSPYLLADLPSVPGLDDDKVTVHRYYGDLTRIAFYNALLYQIGEAENRPAYLATARAALLRGYEGPLYQLDPNLKGTAVDEIYQGVWAQNFASAYDLVQPGLEAGEDREIRGMLARHARYLYDNLYSWASSPHNHLSKPAWGLGTLALCLSSHENARKWLHRAVEAANRNTRYFFGRDGLYREGAHYYVFSLINFVPFLYHYRNVSGVNAFEAFQPAFEWPILIRNGKGWIPNLEDSYLKPFPSQLVAGAYLDSPTRLHSTASLGSILQWNFEHTDFGPFDAAEASKGFNYTGASWDYPRPLIEFLCYQPGIRGVAPDIEPTVFLPSGQTVFRNDWSFASPGHRYLLFQGVAEADNHQHFEHLSFILQAENQMMSSDAGYSRRSYGEAIRREWYRTPEAHNVIMVDGRAPVDRADNATPESRFRLVSPFFACEMKAAPYASGGGHHRLIAFVDRQWFGIVDRVELPVEGEIEVVMHGGRAGLESKGNRSLWSYGQDAYGPPATLAQWFFGEGFRYEERMGELTYIKGDYAAFPYWVNAKRGTAAFSLSVLDPVPDSGSGLDFTVDALEGDRLAVRCPGRWIIANGTGLRWAMGELESDGLLAVLWMGGSAPTRMAMAGGKYLRLTDRIEIELSSPAAMAVEFGAPADSMIITLSEGPGIEAAISMGPLSWKGSLYSGRQVIVLDR